MTDYPASLGKIRINIWELIDPVLDDMQENCIDCRVSFRIDELQELIEGIDEYQMSDYWFRGMTNYYCGILSAWPWELIATSNNEERIWKYILEYHASVNEKTGVLRFRFNNKSPINRWLHHYTSSGDVPINVQTILRFAIKYLIHRDERMDTSMLFKFEEEYYCYKCDAYSVPRGRWGDCEYCYERHWEPDEDETQKICRTGATA